MSKEINRIYLVRYNDSFGATGDQESIEGFLTKASDFSRWLKKHNAERVADGNEPEDADEFDVEEVERLNTTSK